MAPMWTRFRRLVAILMLAAVATFVLHSGAMIGLDHHANRDEISQIVASDDCDLDSVGCCHTPHCSSACTQVLPAIEIVAVDALPEAVKLALLSQLAFGVEPKGLERPPRTVEPV